MVCVMVDATSAFLQPPIFREYPKEMIVAQPPFGVDELSVLWSLDKALPWSW